MIDAADGDPVERFHAIDRELAAYGAGLDERSQVVVLNKIDLLEAPPPFELADDRVVRVVATSTATGAGIDELKHALFELCPSSLRRRTTSPSSRSSSSTGRSRAAARRSASCAQIGAIGSRAARRLPAELEEALRAAGIRRGVEVEVDGEALEWQE